MTEKSYRKERPLAGAAAKKLLVGVSLTVLTALFCGYAAAQNVPRITKEELRTRLGNPDVFVIDVRLPQEWMSSDKKIEGAIRKDPLDVGAWMSNFPKDKTLVFYCS